MNLIFDLYVTTQTKKKETWKQSSNPRPSILISYVSCGVVVIIDKKSHDKRLQKLYWR